MGRPETRRRQPGGDSCPATGGVFAGAVGWIGTAGLVLAITSACGPASRHAARPTGPTTTIGATSLAAPPAATSAPGAEPTTPATPAPRTVPPTTGRPAPPGEATTVLPVTGTSPRCEGCAGSPGATSAVTRSETTAWCPGRLLRASAGPAGPFAGNGARVVVTLQATAAQPCLVPAHVEVRLTNPHGTIEAEALSTPAVSSTLAIGPSTDAGLSMTWVRQGCFESRG